MSIANLPADMLGNIFKDCSECQILSCMRVSKQWNQLLKDDAIWRYFTNHYQLNVESDIFKAVRIQLLSKEDSLRKQCSKEFLVAFSILFDKYTFLYSFPVIKVNHEDMSKELDYSAWRLVGDARRYFSEKYFAYPITIVVVQNHFEKTAPNYLLCSLKVVDNIKTMPVQVAFNFCLSNKNNLSIDLFYNSNMMKTRFQTFSGFDTLTPAKKMNRLCEIIQGKYQLLKPEI